MRKICTFTGSRAEYGLLKPLMDEIVQDQKLQLQLLVSGSHLSSDFGNTIQLIHDDGFQIDAQVDIISAEDSDLGTCQAIGRGTAKYAQTLKQLQPDLLILLGDRFEAFAAATAALVCKVPIAHLHGGETTEGAIDEAFRHAISKMSQLHFTATETYRERVIQLGEQPEQVFNVGAIGLSYLNATTFLNRNALERDLNFYFGQRLALITFHPATLNGNAPEQQFGELLAALDELSELHIIFTKANIDHGGRAINQMIDNWTLKQPKRAIAHSSLGHLRYLSALSCCDLVIGNSSSGLIEAPSFGVPTINIGDRQKGRISATSVIDCPPETSAIIAACHRALSPEFRNLAKQTENPYFQNNTVKKIMNVLKTTPIGSTQKTFYDLPLK